MKEFKYKINGSPYTVVVNKSDDEIVELEVNGVPYTVEMERKTQKPLAPLKRANTQQAVPASNTPLVTRPSSPAGKNSIQSPLPGVILDVRCNEGDMVKKGQTLMILEAMKMENNILANTNGKITQILVNKGDSVLEGAELVIIE